MIEILVKELGLLREKSFGRQTRRKMLCLYWTKEKCNAQNCKTKAQFRLRFGKESALESGGRDKRGDCARVPS